MAILKTVDLMLELDLNYTSRLRRSIRYTLRLRRSARYFR